MRQAWKRWMGVAMLAGLFWAQPALANPGERPGQKEDASTKENARENVIILPYIALGGDGESLHFITGVSFQNLHDAPESITVEIFDNDWEPLPVIVNDETEFSGQDTWTIPADDTRVFVLTHPSDSLIRGWVRLSSAEQASIQVVTVVRAYDGDALVLETGATAVLQKQNQAGIRLAGLHEPFPGCDAKRIRRESLRRS
jgi:hypothetical protein